MGIAGSVFITAVWIFVGFPGDTSAKEPACQCRRQETWVLSLGQEDPLEEGMATHSSILACRIPWTEKSSGLQSMGLQSWTRLRRLSRAQTCIELLLQAR